MSLDQDLSISQILPPLLTTQVDEQSLEEVPEQKDEGALDGDGSGDESPKNDSSPQNQSYVDTQTVGPTASPSSELDEKLASIFQTGKTERVLAGQQK